MSTTPSTLAKTAALRGAAVTFRNNGVSPRRSQQLLQHYAGALDSRAARAAAGMEGLRQAAAQG